VLLFDQGGVMTARIYRFPIQSIRICRDGDAWLVTAGAHGWLHGSSGAANFNLPV